jgi:uncharacterized protein (TIGR03382 family)
MRWPRLAFPLAPALLALPLMAPNCPSGPVAGNRQFGNDSIVIPMDECWQPYQNPGGGGDTEPSGGTGLGSSCSSTYTPGVLYAYGLVYYLVQNGINVYWIINPNKTTVSDVDFSVPTPDGGSQATLYNWDAGTAHDSANGTAISNEAAFPDAGTGTTAECAQAGLCYRGGPFIIDGADYKTVYALLSSAGLPFSAFVNKIQLHVMHPAAPFTAFVNRTLAGSPPKIGILAVPGTDCKPTAPILTQYLTDSALGLDAGGDAGIYDNLYAGDFDPDGGSFVNSNLYNYNLLWIPHFVLDDGNGKYAFWSTTQGTCPTSGDGGPLTQGEATNLQSVIGQFVAAGNNLFAECGGIGALEGSTGNTKEINYSISTEFMTYDGGVKTQGNPSPTNGLGFTITTPTAPFVQIGDFPFVAQSGIIASYEPNGAYQQNVQTLIYDSSDAGLLTWIPSGGNGADAGTVVYLGGHSYTTFGGTQNIAGERMVLNTLLSLAAKCQVPADAGCSTGLPGPCGAGQFQCVGGALTCVQMVFAQPETCNGVDDDCNGLVDDSIPPVACYDGGTPGSVNCQGMADAGYACGCHSGSSFCINGMFGACEGASYPTTETCNGIDDDCDGFIDNMSPGDPTPISTACYDGPPGTEDAGLCQGGTQVCDGGTFGVCQGEVTPVYGLCDGLDHNCDGVPDTCTACTDGQTQPCYDGPAGTVGVGVCKAGIQTCVDGGFGACQGEVLPQDAGCDGIDHNCDGYPDLCQSCTPGDSRPCYTGPAGTQNVGICHGGTQTCDPRGNWGACVGQILPTAEICDGIDESCSGVVDQGAPCPAGNACVNGSCVPSVCGGESNITCPTGYTCDAANGCQPVTCGGTDAGICPSGESCLDGGCADPCQGVQCGPGSFCGGGQCLAGGCTSSGCPATEICVASSCVPDPCNGVTCPDGTFCRGGYCVQACGFVTCPSGEQCDSNGDCVASACGGGCTSPQVCSDGGCVADPCHGVSCAKGQTCQAGTCVDDPCNGVHCPGLMACVDGQCVGQIVDGGSFTGGTNGHHGPGGDTTGGGTSGSTSGGATGGQASSGGSQSGTQSSTGGQQTTGANPPPGQYVTGSGCGCGAGSGGGSAMPLGFLGLMLLLRRRRVGAGSGDTAGEANPMPRALLTLGLGALLLGSGLVACSSGGTTTSGTTGQSGTTSGGTGGVTGTSQATNGGSATNATSGTGGSGTAGCSYETCSGNCVDLANDSLHCGSCDHACLTNEICVEGACGQGGQNPHLDSLSPDVASVDSQLTVTLTGERFLSGAQVLLTGAGLPANDLNATTFVSATSLTAALSFAGAPAGSVTVAVVNPGELISNTVSFTLAAAGVPVLQSVTPAQAPTGSSASLAFVGQSLTASTEIHSEGGTVPNTALITSCPSSTACTASWDLSTVAPGNYSVFAVNPGIPTPSNSLSFTVASITPALTSTMPASATSNSQPSVELIGTGFDSSSKIQFGPAGTTLQPVPTTYISQTQIFAALNLTNLAPGNYELLVVNNGGLQSGRLAFAVISATPALLSLTPSQGASGTNVPLNAGGVGFDPSSALHFQDTSGGGDTALATHYNGPSSLGATLSLSGITPGAYQLLVVNSGGLSSPAFPFSVTSNTPTVTGVNPASLTQSAGVQNVALTGTSFTSGMTVQLSPLPSGSAVSFDATITDGQDATISVDPSQLTVASYLLTAVNSGNFTSNAANFSITPGTPTLASLTPSDSAQQQTTVVVCGQFFLPTSTVHVTGLNGSYSPTATYSDGGTADGGCADGGAFLTVSPDLTSASPGDYSVTVWNSATLQSNALTFTVDGP